MKKYIAPVAKNIIFHAESLMAVSGPHDEEGQNFQFSNKRSASGAIWGFDDEADRDY